MKKQSPSSSCESSCDSNKQPDWNDLLLKLEEKPEKLMSLIPTPREHTKANPKPVSAMKRNAGMSKIHRERSANVLANSKDVGKRVASRMKAFNDIMSVRLNKEISKSVHDQLKMKKSCYPDYGEFTTQQPQTRVDAGVRPQTSAACPGVMRSSTSAVLLGKLLDNENAYMSRRRVT